MMEMLYKEFTDSIEGVDLKKYIGKRNKFNPLNSSDRSQMIEAMVYSNTAIGEIASSALIFGLIRNSMTNVVINGETIVPNTGIIDMGNGVKGPADTVLRVYLQAAVDNPKFLLLKDWNYNVTALRKKLFKTKAGLTLDAFDTESDSGWVTNDIWKALNEVIWKRYKIASNIRNLNTIDGENNSVEGVINDSQNYAKFINGRLNKTLPTNVLDSDGIRYNVEATFNNNVGLLEKAVTKVYEMFDKYVESGPQGSDSRKSPLRFDETTYEAAHMQAKENMDINSKLEILKSKIGDTKFNAAQLFAKNILKDSETAMTSKETKNRRPLQPNSWQTNPDLVNIIIFKLEKLQEQSMEGQEVVTLTMLKEIKNGNLDLLPPHTYLHKSVNQYYKENTKYLRGEPTAQEASDVSLDEAKRRHCG